MQWNAIMSGMNCTCEAESETDETDRNSVCDGFKRK